MPFTEFDFQQKYLESFKLSELGRIHAQLPLKELAEKRYSVGETAMKCAEYEHARPFTRESLMYRELFEHFYPGQSQMVTDFWMPNKAWPGCNVDDPSARVLSNYGFSGV